MDLVLSVLMLAVIALVIGAIYLLRKGGHRNQALLMLVLAAIAALNVAIWTVPGTSGTAPVDRLEELEK